MAQRPRPSSPEYLTLTLHAHLPYVVNHGTWPHGMEWLHEAAAETYLPLLRLLRNLERDEVRFQCNLDLSPVLLEQMVHPVFRAEFPKYLQRKMTAAREDEAFFLQSGEEHYVELARMWHGVFAEALTDFEALGGDLVRGFRHFNDTGLIDIITCCATHGYLPLLGTDESVSAQVRTAVTTHVRHFGRAPAGIWLPECGYRPAGLWQYPVANPDGSVTPGFDRVGVEQIVRESDLDFFFVDTHLIEASDPVRSPYGAAPPPRAAGAPLAILPAPEHDVYRPYLVAGPYTAWAAPVSVFPRDPRTGVQVWSGELGYPGDAAYLDFHKKRWPGGHRYWRVSGPTVEMADKAPYNAEAARARVRDHAAHFVQLVTTALASEPHDGTTPILCAPFDAELFGHWWFEGPLWLEEVARQISNRKRYDHTSLELTSCREYLVSAPAQERIAMREGSWGAEGGNQVWLNPETSWTWTHIYPAERATRSIVSEGAWRETELGRRIVQQLCRELLLLESSDWQFLITTGAARDYAEARFLTHSDQFNELRAMWTSFAATGGLDEQARARLAEIITRDGIFPDLDPALWTAGRYGTGAPEASDAELAAESRRVTEENATAQPGPATAANYPEAAPTGPGA